MTPKVISSQGKDDSPQARKSLSHQADDANHYSIDRSLQKRSRKAQEDKKTSRGDRDDLLLQTGKNKTQLRVASSAKSQQDKKASKTQGNHIPQAAEDSEAPKYSAHTTTNKSETSRTTASNPVSVAKAPKNKSLPKVKPDSISIKTANGSLSGDEDQKEREEMLASPVKGSDAQTASTVSQIILFDCTFMSLPLFKALVKLEKTNERPKNRSKAELLQLEKEDVLTWNNTLEPNYVKYYLSSKSVWSADAKLLEIAQSLYNEVLGSKKPLVWTQSSGPFKLVSTLLLLFFRISCTFS